MISPKKGLELSQDIINRFQKENKELKEENLKPKEENPKAEGVCRKFFPAQPE
jgi:hypothetical protein